MGRTPAGGSTRSIAAGVASIPPPTGQSGQARLQIIHEANIDTPRTCLRSCCAWGEGKTWSDAKPGHVPVMIEVEMKDALVTPATFDALEAEIARVAAKDDHDRHGREMLPASARR